MSRRPFGPDSWLGLVPEVERLVPDLVTRLEGADAGCALRGRIEDLIRSGDAEGWMRFLRDLRDRYASLVGEDDAATLTLAEILRDQYRLAPGVLDMGPRDEEASALLEQVTGR